MAAVSYKDIPVYLSIGDKYTAVLAQNVNIQYQNSLSINRVLNESQSTQFDGYGINGPLTTNISFSFFADTFGSGAKFCLEKLTGDMAGLIRIGGVEFNNCYLNSASVNIQPFLPVVINADFIVHSTASASKITSNSISIDNFNKFEIIYSGGLMTWTQAYNDAIAKKGRLAILNTRDKNADIEFHENPLWIGATDEYVSSSEADELKWQWVDGSLLSDSYTNWAFNKPIYNTQEDYAARLGKNSGSYYGKWNDFKNQALFSGYIIEFPETKYKQQIVYGHTVLPTNNKTLSEEHVDSITYSVVCNRVPRYTIGSVYPDRMFLDTIEKEISIKSTNINKFINYEGYDGQFAIDLLDEKGKSALSSNINLSNARVMNQSVSTQEGDILVAEIKAKEVVF
jgi:hypothetical protein